MTVAFDAIVDVVDRFVESISILLDSAKLQSLIDDTQNVVRKNGSVEQI